MASIHGEASTFNPPARDGLAEVKEADSQPMFPWVQSSSPSSRVPYELQMELVGMADDLVASVRSHKWLFPPQTEDSEAGDTAPQDKVTVPAKATSATRAVREDKNVDIEPEMDDPSVQETSPAAPAVQHDFQFLQTETAKGVVRLLLRPSKVRATGTGATVARQLEEALKDFSERSYDILTQVRPDGRPILPEEDRQKLVQEAEMCMRTRVSSGSLSVATDFVFCLEAFGVSKGRSQTEQSWLCSCLQHVLRAAISAAPPADVDEWKASVQARMSNETGELYGSVDVRAWPHILSLASADHTAILPEAFKLQLQLQLCSGGETAKWFEGLQQAATLVAELRQAANFGADELRELFNDKTHFERFHRQKLLIAALEKAPRVLVQQVLRQIDGDDVDIAERDDEEIVLVRELIKALGEDIRCCRHAFFKMQSDWLVTRWSGCVHNEELSPEQVCDHIEGEDNHEELLKIATNRCLRSNRKFEAARMLARPASNGTRVYETNRNDKQLAYLVSLYQELEKPIDQFGPVDEASLVVPCSWQDVLVIKNAGDSLQRLERDLLSGSGQGRPLTLGLWWTWRCLDPKLDFWPRASFVAFAYDDTFAIIDLIELEKASDATERRCKDVLRKILEAPHILKVVHTVDRSGLSILQHACVPQQDLVSDELPELPVVAPILDFTGAVAFSKRTRPGAQSASNLTKLVFDYLRLEFCMGEALSNFERRPLRLTQIHYALSLAFAPLMMLRSFCAYGLMRTQDICHLSLRLGVPGAPTKWDETFKDIVFSREGDQDPRDYYAGTMQMGIEGKYAQNEWLNPEWVATVPKPDAQFSLEWCMRQHVAPLVLSPEHQEMVMAAAGPLFNQRVVNSAMEKMYQAYSKHERPQQGGG